jgi:hypothetical protein
MTEPSKDRDTFAAALQAAYIEVRLHSPQGIDEVEERLRSKLEPNGVTLTNDVLRALAFAVVNGRNL